MLGTIEILNGNRFLLLRGFVLNLTLMKRTEFSLCSFRIFYMSIEPLQLPKLMTLLLTFMRL